MSYQQSDSFFGRWRQWRRRAAHYRRVSRIIRNKHFHMVFQPIVDLRNGRVFAYEALLRSDSPHFDSPVELFDAAAAGECVSDLGRAARAQAMEDCEDWPLFINIHPAEFASGVLVQPTDPVFTHPLEVHVEITESVPLSHFDLCHSVLEEIRGKGIKLAIDDLGAGYSNLKYIAELSPEIVKIDRDLVAAISANERHRQLVGHIVDMCSGMGARVVAEGIETTEELLAVQDAGVDFGQGFLLARPAFPPPAVNWPEEALGRGELKKRTVRNPSRARV